MLDQQLIHEKMQRHYEQVWQGGDAWQLESSAYEQARYDAQLASVADRRYARTLEIGCGSGCFTRQLSAVSDFLMAIDIAPAAIERARVVNANAGDGRVEFEAANIMEFDLSAAGPWDLIVLSETIYCLGWLYSFAQIGWFAARLFEATNSGGRLLLANTYGRERDWLLHPWLIDTYRDLFLNVGYEREREDVFRGAKDGVSFEVLITVLARPSVVEARPTSLFAESCQ